MSQETSLYAFIFLSGLSLTLPLLSCSFLNMFRSEIMSKHTVTGGADFLEVREDIDTDKTDFVCTL
jgi:hypothetical protein